MITAPDIITRRRRAFSLIETLAALAIFSVTIVGIIEAVTIQLRAEGDAEDMTQAVLLAQNLVEDMRMAGAFEPGEESAAYEGDLSRFTWSYKMEEEDGEGLFRLTVTISWENGMALKSFTLETLLYDR